jgi:hypothetical protein
MGRCWLGTCVNPTPREISFGLQRTCGWVVSPEAVKSQFTKKELEQIRKGNSHLVK